VGPFVLIIIDVVSTLLSRIYISLWEETAALLLHHP
jgi:hypothetical protein